jgi:serine/threonine protein kinase
LYNNDYVLNANIIIQVTTDLEQVYVCDMGIAKVKRVAEATVTAVTKGPGTFPYMAPEMFKKSHRGPAVDIYSLGCLFIELFGKQRVWPDLDQTAIMMNDESCGVL